MLSLDTSIEKIAGVGPKMAARLAKLGIEKIHDLIFHFPCRYDDFSKITEIAKVGVGTFCLKGKVLEIKNQRTPRRRMFLTHAIIQDSTGSIKAVWYRQPYLTKMLKKGDQIILVGAVEYSSSGLIIQNPTWEKFSRQTIHSGRIVPVYPETQGINSKWLRKIILPLLKLIDGLPDFLPDEIIEKNSLINYSTALRQIHFPDSVEWARQAKKRLAFDELFLLQLKMLELKKKWQSYQAPKIELDIGTVKKLVAELSFKLTNAQRRAAWEILKDINSEVAMNRLLEGDVGSGKTIVAAIAMLVCANSGYQSILMAPTEVLANQHFIHLSDILSPFGLKVGLLISSKAEVFPARKSAPRAKIIADIKSGKINIVIGTHSLIADKVNFKKVGLAIIDEQHRFGVKQRALLRRKAKTCPHLLSMTATPIPRTLTLALYGDLDLSIIDEMPAGRQRVATYLVKPEKRPAAYQFIADQIKQGRQIFVVCPLIEESDKLGVKSAEQEYQKLKKEIFPQFKIGLLHGKMPVLKGRGLASAGKSKLEIMEEFKNHKYDILVSTAVIEVGVDVPNATVMMIEGAERFGLAQLHQFRGRVGRAGHKSFCFLFTESPSEKTYQRLSALVNLYDGFKLAEKDLQIRGPGEIYGIRQHGLADLKTASLTDIKMLKLARQEAEWVIAAGLTKFPKLEKILDEYKAGRQLE